MGTNGGAVNHLDIAVARCGNCVHKPSHKPFVIARKPRVGSEPIQTQNWPWFLSNNDNLDGHPANNCLLTISGRRTLQRRGHQKSKLRALLSDLGGEEDIISSSQSD
jgi:hypothetical protein